METSPRATPAALGSLGIRTVSIRVRLGRRSSYESSVVNESSGFPPSRSLLQMQLAVIRQQVSAQGTQQHGIEFPRRQHRQHVVAAAGQDDGVCVRENLPDSFDNTRTVV